MTRVVPDYSDGTAPDSHRLPYYDPEGSPRTCSRVPSNAADSNRRNRQGANRLAVSICHGIAQSIAISAPIPASA